MDIGKNGINKTQNWSKRKIKYLEFWNKSIKEKYIDLKEIQKEILQNKINKGFNITDINKEFCLLYGEVSEAYDAYRKNKDDLGEELADIAIYLLGISEILGKDLEEEIINKIEINKNRKYKNVNGTMIKIKD